MRGLLYLKSERYMRMKRFSLTAMAVLVTLILNLVSCKKNEITWFASGNGGIVAAGPEASVKAGLKILSKGGNAVDGAVATVFNLAVSDYGSFCIGGEVPFMYFNSNTQKVKVFNGMGGAPGDQETIDGFYSSGIPIDRDGIKLSTVPSAVSTLLAALEADGTISFEQVIAPTLVLLDEGGEDWYPNLAKTFRRLISTEKETRGTREEKIRAARDRFYKGDIADELNTYYISSGGFLRKSDLESHVTKIEQPVTINYRGYDVYKCNTWTQGPVLLQSLKLLENFNLKSMGFCSADYIHITVESMKLAYADRDKYYGDPAFSVVPLEKLLSDQYTKLRIPLIDMNNASLEIRPGDPYNMIASAGPGQYWPGEHGTTTCVVVDKWGNAVAATPSSNGEYGICESLGIAHNTRMTSFNTQKGHPNSVQPGKRPRITLTPTIVLKDNKAVIAMSVAGGDMQDQVALQLLLDNIEFGMRPKEALSSPRFHTYHTEDSFNPSTDPAERFLNIGALDIYSTDQSVIDNLVARKHIVKIVPEPIAAPAMVYIDQLTGVSYAATEPFYERESSRGKLCGVINPSGPGN
ncbi:MAG: gamma-glutamyltranspeptidase / glutathione hydrolase [Bacteroidota bacterium]|nr:gamma-glutamyltranspeptidase / glutathione hydrolase [Bacteroidota bacterium]